MRKSCAWELSAMWNYPWAMRRCSGQAISSAAGTVEPPRIPAVIGRGS
jgi:hypothetical protein